MADENTPPENNENLDKDQARKEREERDRARNAEMFDDVGGGEETLEDVQDERDELRQTVANLTGSLTSLQNENVQLQREAANQKTEAALAIKRAENRFEEQKSFALEKFVKEILPVIDNIELGLGAISADQRAADPKFDKLAQGFEKGLVQLTAVFNKFGVKAINPLNEEVDPNKHDIVSVDDSVEAESETVVKVMQKGYEINGRVIRNAKVVVKP